VPDRCPTASTTADYSSPAARLREFPQHPRQQLATLGRRCHEALVLVAQVQQDRVRVEHAHPVVLDRRQLAVRVDLQEGRRVLLALEGVHRHELEVELRLVQEQRDLHRVGGVVEVEREHGRGSVRSGCCRTAQHSTAQHSTAQHSTAQAGTVDGCRGMRCSAAGRSSLPPTQVVTARPRSGPGIAEPPSGGLVSSMHRSPETTTP